MQDIQNYVCGQWVSGSGMGAPIVHAITGEIFGHVSSAGIDLQAVYDYARTIGNPNLRKLTFQERALRLKALALYLNDRKEQFYEVSYKTGATRADSWVDIEGGFGNLFANASLRRKLPNQTFCIDGDYAPLSKGGSFIGQHILVPKLGTAVHINAFNFPVWGMLEKIAVNLLAGMPAIVKPASLTSYLTEAVVREIIGSGILPEGALQLISGSAHNILDYIEEQDVVTFTGSADTGRKLRAHPRIIEYAVPFNLEADSLNCIVLGEDVEPGSPEFDLFIKEVRREMTTKAGQKCTAVRRIFTSDKITDAVSEALTNVLRKVTIGDTKEEAVRMGALASSGQVAEVRDKIEILKKDAEVVLDDFAHFDLIGPGVSRDSFMSPVLLLSKNKMSEAIHEIEAFGPVATIVPYDTIGEAVHLANRGKGSLVSSIVTYDDKIASEYVLQAAPYHGRILVLNRDCAKESTGHGSPMPLLVHGGPGRAGGGEEMGGLRGIKHYMQRCAVQGSPTTLTEITQVYQPGGKYRQPAKHPFRLHFEELTVGDTLITHGRTITEADIVNFANVSWDHFYAHTDVTTLDGTIFTERVAHGYFVLSAAAGLFVDPGKGPVLLNYGLEECRFIKPVYAGMTLHVRLTVKEKVDQEKKSEDDIPKGIVKFYVDIRDQEQESVAIATILTMIRKQAV